MNCQPPKIAGFIQNLTAKSRITVYADYSPINYVEKRGKSIKKFGD